MADLHARQIRALRIRSTFTGTPFDRFHKGVQYASTELSKILNAHPNENGELRSALRAFVANGPVFDSSDYEDGQACVHDDVVAVLGGDRGVIAALLDTLNKPEGD